MSKWDDKTTNEIVMEIANMKEKHEALKREMIGLYDEMEKVEKEFSEANKVVNDRLSGK